MKHKKNRVRPRPVAYESPRDNTIKEGNLPKLKLNMLAQIGPAQIPQGPYILNDPASSVPVNVSPINEKL